ncbi:MAG: cytochrome c-type biogenesis protein CcmH [Thermoplasmata archaeon]|nr:cytochrome c-type biogenesis protein CcmH [Thermoplasmata archaeon]
MYPQFDSHDVYYCPKCDRTIPKERLESIDEELRVKFDMELAGSMRCPVCETEFIDLEHVHPEGGKHVGEKRRNETEIR